MRKVILILFSLVFSLSSISQELASTDSEIIIPVTEVEKASNLLLYQPRHIFKTPEVVLYNTFSIAIPLSYYSQEELKLQQALNNKEDAIVVRSNGDNRFFPRSIDREEITPYTWKWVKMKYEEENGNYYIINLRRPNWWFKENNASKIGDKVHVTVPEIGLNQEVAIVSFYPNQLDTRLWDSQENGDYLARPITGKFQHHANNVVNLHFNESETPISVTTNHLLWSHDRANWIKVGELLLGEKITTKEGIVTVKDRIAKEGWYEVYDIEVYRDHNFLVSLQNVLAHNGCKRTGATHNGFYEVIKDGDVNYAGKGPASRSKTSKSNKRGDKVIHYEIDEKIAGELGLSVKDASFIMEYKLGSKRAKQLYGPNKDFKDLPSNGKSMSPGYKKYNALSDEAKAKVDAKFEEIISKGGTEY